MKFIDEYHDPELGKRVIELRAVISGLFTQFRMLSISPGIIQINQ